MCYAIKDLESLGIEIFFALREPMIGKNRIKGAVRYGYTLQPHRLTGGSRPISFVCIEVR